MEKREGEGRKDGIDDYTTFWGKVTSLAICQSGSLLMLPVCVVKV